MGSISNEVIVFAFFPAIIIMMISLNPIFTQSLIMISFPVFIAATAYFGLRWAFRDRKITKKLSFFNFYRSEKESDGEEYTHSSN